MAWNTLSPEALSVVCPKIGSKRKGFLSSRIKTAYTITEAASSMITMAERFSFFIFLLNEAAKVLVLTDISHDFPI